MMQLSIILTRQHRLLSLAAIVDVFETVNRMLQEEGKSELFNINLTGSTKEINLPESIRKYPYRTYAAEQQYNLIFIPAFMTADIAHTVEENACFIPWLQQQYHQGAALASICTGAFLLAASGLLNNRSATTHVDAMDKLSTQFPEIKLQPNAVVTHDHNIYTSGGATSGFYLKLALIQKYCGREMAIRTAKMFSIDMDRENQAHFAHFTPIEGHNDRLVMQVQHKIKMEYPFIKSIEEAISDVPASRRNLVRRFKQATGLTPIRYLQKTKIEAAKKLLENTDKGLLEVMLEAGYNDVKNFRQLFKENTGMTPKAYRNKFAMRFEPII